MDPKISLRSEKLCRTLTGEIPVRLVRDADVTIRAGEFVAITGPSGSGKSSLLYLLGLLDRPTSGKLWLQDTETSQLGAGKLAQLRLSRIGFVFQSHFLLPEFTAAENVMLPMQKLGKLGTAAARKRATEILDSLGLGAQVDKLPKQMSGGQSQRVAIARSMANDPDIILADEPTGNLDTASSQNVQGILQKLAHERGRTVVFVTHDPAFAKIADRIIHIVDGQITAAETPAISV